MLTASIFKLLEHVDCSLNSTESCI